MPSPWVLPACGFAGGGAKIRDVRWASPSPYAVLDVHPLGCKGCWMRSLAGGACAVSRSHSLPSHLLFCCVALPSSYKKGLIILPPPCLPAVLEGKIWLSTMTNLCWGQAGRRGPSRCTLQDSILPFSRTQKNKDLSLNFKQ